MFHSPIGVRASPSLDQARLPTRQRILLGIILSYGILLRVWDLGSKPFWVDEAESSINALTILEHGLPGDHYLGLPIYENQLVRPWPESPEYEFQDSSYSRRGLAIYHGWLPLYVTAASFALAGVKPDQDVTALRVQHSAAEMHRRTVAGRVPAVLFGALFLLAIFFSARELYGADAGWAALAAGTVFKPVVDFARQARYYSPTLALTACAGLMIWRMARRGKGRDFIFGAAVFVLLFHTHFLAFLSATAAFGLTLPWLYRQPRVAGKLTLFAVLVAAGVVPWILLTGFAQSVADLPKARSLLSVEDLWDFVRKLRLFPLLAGSTLLWLLLAERLRKKVPERLVRSFVEYRWPFLFLAGWVLISQMAFVGFVPAASYFYGRLVLTILVPCLLFGAMLFAGVARALSLRYTPLLASCLFVLVLLPPGQVSLWPTTEAPGTPSTFDVIESLRSFEIQAGTRIYATPNEHLTLTFYTGMPIQNVAPVRKSFIDGYQGELLFLESGPRYEALDWREIQCVLSATGYPLSDTAAQSLEPLLANRLLYEDLQGRVARVTPALEPAPDFFTALLRFQRTKTAEVLAEKLALQGNPTFRGYRLPNYHSWWQIYYYRFVYPEARTGSHLNYAGRTRDAEAFVLPLEWVLYHCPAGKTNSVDP
jgi:hypothetical protein